MQAIIVVGDVDVKSVENKIKNLFGQLPKAENPKAKDVILIPDNKEPIVSIFTDKENTSTSAEVYFKSQPLPKEYRGLGMAVIMNLYKNMISRMFSERFSDISSKPDAPFFGAGAGFGKLCSTLEAFYGNVQSKDGEAVKALKAMFVELESTVEGLIRLDDLVDDHYTFDESTISLIGKKNKRGYRLGDNVGVIVKAANKEARTVDFVLDNDHNRKIYMKRM